MTHFSSHNKNPKRGDALKFSSVWRGGLAAAAIFLGLVVTFIPAGAQAPPTETKLDGGITRINIAVPISDGKFARSDLYLPTATGPVPSVVVIPTHFMVLYGYSEDFDKNYALALAKLGYAALVPTLNQYGVRGTYDLRHAVDLPMIAKWLRDRPEVMDDRTGAVGFSVGGYYISVLAANDPTVRAVIGYYGVYDLENPNLYFSKAVERFWPGSPKRNVEKVSGATLLLHGEADDETPLGQATSYRDALAAAGKTVEVVAYPRAHHRFDRGKVPSQQSDLSPSGHTHRLDTKARDDSWQRSTAWLEKYLKAD